MTPAARPRNMDNFMSRDLLAGRLVYCTGRRLPRGGASRGRTHAEDAEGAEKSKPRITRRTRICCPADGIASQHAATGAPCSRRRAPRGGSWCEILKNERHANLRAFVFQDLTPA